MQPEASCSSSVSFVILPFQILDLLEEQANGIE
jgi:hypothetical protein